VLGAGSWVLGCTPQARHLAPNTYPYHRPRERPDKSLYLASLSRYFDRNFATFGAITAEQYGWYGFRLK
jgi:hypothetical protein